MNEILPAKKSQDPDKLQNEVEPIYVLEYKDIPHFPQTTVAGHTGKLIYGLLEGKKVLMMSGRFHYYEGYEMHPLSGRRR